MRSRMISGCRSVAVFLTLVLMLQSGSVAQTKVKAPKNPYSPDKDVQLGREAAAEVERQLPLLENRQVERYVRRIGRRLAEAIPPQFQHPQFAYSFKVVNARDINAFALPGGFTFVNRGLIEVANNEGELAGVMAHEISHVALRHGTAQFAKAQRYSILAAAGQIAGAILGGVAGGVIAQGSQLGVGVYFLKFSREYERQADTLGAQMMAAAGYDPRHLANMFRTIERESGGGGPQWLSSHPNPGNRYEAINREAQQLKVTNTVQDTGDFQDVRAVLRDMPRAASMEEIARGRAPEARPRPVGGRIEYPSARYRNYTARGIFQIAVPDNWQELPGSSEVTFAPEGAYGNVRDRFVFTHGVIVGATGAQGVGLRRATEAYISELTRNNPELRARSSYQRGEIAGREALAATFRNVSEVTSGLETVVVYTTLLDNGDLFYMIGVAPQDEFGTYQRAFQRMLSSIRFD